MRPSTFSSGGLSHEGESLPWPSLFSHFPSCQLVEPCPPHTHSHTHTLLATKHMANVANLKLIDGSNLNGTSWPKTFAAPP